MKEKSFVTNQQLGSSEYLFVLVILTGTEKYAWILEADFFSTSISTLTVQPHSKLAAIVSGKYPIKV
jgi:hypothetical protein